MSKCILDIKFDITDTARDLAMDNGGFTYIHGERDSLRITDNTLAELSAKKVNDAFGEMLLTPSYGDRKTYFISPSNELAQKYLDYYNSELAVEENKPTTEGEDNNYTNDEPTNFLQVTGFPSTVATPAIIEKVKEAATKMGISIEDLATYAKNTGLDTTNINGVADLARGVIAIAEGQEDVALTEELVHIATAMIEQTNPQLVTQMISRIDKFAIYNQTYKLYKDNKDYQLPNGKPDIRKIKKEAVDKLIAEVIVNEGTGNEYFPELANEDNISLVQKWWSMIKDFIHGLYSKASIDIFREAASEILGGKIEGIPIINGQGPYYQIISPQQKAIQDNINNTRDSLRKVEYAEKNADPLLLDSEEANNGYEIKNDDGTWTKITKRVTDRVKAWYKERFGNKVFSEQEKKFNELKRTLGVAGHRDLEEIHSRYYNEDGTKREYPEPRPTKYNLESRAMYETLENYYTELIETFPKDTLVFSEVVIYDKKNKEAGTIDFLAVEPEGKTHILDWKFMHIAGNDVAWFKQGAFNIQIGTYKNILRENYGIKDFGMLRAIPISLEFERVDKMDARKGFKLDGIAIGSVDKSKIDPLTEMKLIPLSEESETTGSEALDGVLGKLNALMREYAKEKVTDEGERIFKIERMNTLRRAIRLVQGTGNLQPLVDVIQVMRRDGDRILNDYNTIFKDRPARDTDSTNQELSDFADDMNNYIRFSEVFSSIGDDIGYLIYTADMEEGAATEAEKENIDLRKEILQDLDSESKAIRISIKEITKASEAFADKHIGQRNLVAGLTKAEAVIKGLAARFRGVSELPSRALQVLYKLTSTAKNNAASDAFKEVEVLMSLRDKLVARGGDTRKLVQKLYQKTTEGGLVNKLIYKYKKDFFEQIDAKAKEGGDKEWLLNNIDVEAYKKEAAPLLESQIARINKNSYSGSAEEQNEQREKYILEAQRLWDIDREDFNGFNNYVVKRHPKSEWLSDEYLDIQKDPDLLELYNFITKYNEKAKDIGYINNMVAKNFLPFIRKSMAEQLVWDNKLSIMNNFYNSLQARTDDTGYGSINEITGELQNGIPKYYTYDFTQTDTGVNDYSEVSEDLFKNLILYIQQVEKYKYLSEVEGQLNLVRTIESFKGHLNTTRYSDVVRKDGKVQELPGNEENTKIYDEFLRALLYDQKYTIDDADLPLNMGKVTNFIKNGINKVAGKEIFTPEENPTPTSLIKTMDAANRAFQLKTLGFEFISGAANMFGGNIQIATQAGNYFKAREFAKNEAKLIGQSFNNEQDRETFIELVNTFMPLKDDPSYEEFKRAGMTTLTRGSLSDTLMVFMRKPEQLLEKATFLTLLENMMVENGKIVSIREFVNSKYKDRYDSAAKFKESKTKIDAEIEELKKTRSIANTKKMEDGKLVIPGLDLSNREEIQRLTTLTRRISRNAVGNLSDGDINRMSMSIWTKSMMLFKNWIPKLTDTRFSEFRRVSDDFSVEIGEDGIPVGEKYDIGRIRLLAAVIGSSFKDKQTNLLNIMNMNDDGIKKLNEMYEEYREEYERTTGQELYMTKEQFIDMVRNNLQNQIKELAILGSLIGMMFSLGFIAPDDDKDKAAKNFHRYTTKVIDKFVGELSFFYNPVNYQSLLDQGIFPATGIIKDFGRFMDHVWMETTGLDMKSETTAEDVRKKAQPVKNAMKMFPFTKSLVTYLAILDADFAKEYDVTIQKESR